MADHSKPTLTSAYSDFVTELDARLDDLAFALNPVKTTVTNPPVDAIRFNTATKRREKWTGTAWAELVPKASGAYDERVAQADDIVAGSSTAKARGQVGPAAQSAGVNDANLYVTAGRWYVISSDCVSNFPVANVGGLLCVDTRYDGAAIRQVWYRHVATAPYVYTRVSLDSGSTWGAWKHITADADWNAASGADGYIANKPALGTAASADKQTSSTDSTAGRVMAVGAFGLGGVATSVTAAGALNALAYTCTVSVTGANRATVGGPAGANAGTVFTIARSAGYSTQTWFDVTGTTYEMFTRTLNNSVWSSWRKIYDQTAILGTVSQSAGIPTGAIIERGSNANGEYVRFADGTQLCHFNYTETDGAVTAAGAVFRSTTPYTWVFPASFPTLTHLSLFASMQSANAGWANARAVSTGSAEIIKWVPVTEANLRIFRVVAIGRWF